MTITWKEADRSVRSTLATRDSVLVDHCFVCDLKPFVDDGEGFPQLLFVDAERGVGIERVPADQGVEALLAEEASQGGHFVGGAVEGSHGLASLAAAYQFDDA